MSKATDIKKISTLENKHRIKIKEFESEKENINSLEDSLTNINIEISELDKIRDKFTNVEQGRRAELLDHKEITEKKIFSLKNNFKEMDYYDTTGDLLYSYYNIRDNDQEKKESKNILSFLSKKNVNVETPKTGKNKSELFEKYCQITEGIRVNLDDGSKRIKICLECNIEKILNIAESFFIYGEAQEREAIKVQCIEELMKPYFKNDGELLLKTIGHVWQHVNKSNLRRRLWARFKKKICQSKFKQGLS
jgi:hypothetical protein